MQPNQFPLHLSSRQRDLQLGTLGGGAWKRVEFWPLVSGSRSHSSIGKVAFKVNAISGILTHSQANTHIMKHTWDINEKENKHTYMSMKYVKDLKSQYPEETEEEEIKHFHALPPSTFSM